MSKFNRKFMEKARKRLETAKLAIDRNYVCSACSNCYYALFNLMQSVVGKPIGGKWSHGGLPKFFTREVYQNNILPGEEIKGLVKMAEELYAFRRESDYYDTILEYSGSVRKEIESYISKVEKLIYLLEEKFNV